MSAHTCDAAAGPLVGFYATIEGDVGELRNCATCHTTKTVRVHVDAALCASCARVVTGTADDPKTCVHDDSDGYLVLCAGCFRNDVRRVDWMRWDESIHDLEARPFLRDEDPLESAQVSP